MSGLGISVYIAFACFLIVISALIVWVVYASYKCASEGIALILANRTMKKTAKCDSSRDAFCEACNAWFLQSYETSKAGFELRDLINAVSSKCDQIDMSSSIEVSKLRAEYTAQPETATCHICGKRDFMDNLADVGWMEPPADLAESMADLWAHQGARGRIHAHPSCAGIRKSDDGKGWVREVAKGKVSK